jgi:hypothetical protein
MVRDILEKDKSKSFYIIWDRKKIHYPDTLGFINVRIYSRVPSPILSEDVKALKLKGIFKTISSFPYLSNNFLLQRVPNCDPELAKTNQP